MPGAALGQIRVVIMNRELFHPINDPYHRRKNHDPLIKHDNIVCLLDYEETKETICLVMEYCNAGDLAEYLQKQGTLSEDTERVYSIRSSCTLILVSYGLIHTVVNRSRP